MSSEVRIIMTPKHRAERILSEFARPMPSIIKDLEIIADKKDRGVNLDDAQKLEELGLELIKMARDTHSCCF